MRISALVIALVACGHPGTTPTNDKPIPPAPKGFPIGPPLATPGERMQYKVSLKGLELAVYTITVGDVVELDGKKVVLVQANAKLAGIAAWFSQKVDDKFTSWIDIATGRPVQFTADEYGTNTSNVEHSVMEISKRADGAVPVTFRLNEEPGKPEPQKTTLPETWDINSFVIALRSWEDPPGSSHTLEAFRSRYLWRITATTKGKAKVETAQEDTPKLPAVRIDAHLFKLGKDGNKFPDSDERDFSLWIGDDAARVPLKIVAKSDYGDVTMLLVDYNPGTGEPLRKQAFD